MGNNLLNACKNTSAPTDQNDGDNDQTQKEKQEKRKLERKKNQRNKSDFGSVHAEDIIEKKEIPRQEEQSDSSSQQMNGFDGQSYQSNEINSTYNQGSENHLNKMRKSQHNKYSKKNRHIVNNLVNGQNQQKEEDKFSHSESEHPSPKQGGENAEKEADSVEEIRQLKNNNDKYFTKEDQEYYEKKYYNEKKVQPPKDKNIRWQSGEVLGTGSFGQVILGMNIDTGEFMAVKQVHIGGYNQKDRQEKIQQIQSEIEALRNFSDKNIVRYIGIKKSETSINIFLEYVPGGSISSLLYRYGKFNETLIRKFTQQILKGLEYLHAHEIIHRDIKGANVLVDKDGNCKLADFGSAKKIVEEKGHNDSIRGTPYWMAPETIKQLGSGRFADIWSIGCTVIEMATAKPPWADKSPIQAMFYIANAQQPPPIPEHLSPVCKDFISKCLKINPNDRYNVRQLLNHPFILGKRLTHVSQPGRQLPLITEEATVDYQTSSPDKRKEFLTRGESRGNTLFHEENSMKDTLTEKTLVFSVKTKTHKSQKSRKSIRLRESDGENSQDSIDLGKSKNMNNPRPLNPQPKMIQPRSSQQQQNYSNNKNLNYSGEKFSNSIDKNKDNNDNSSKSSDSSRSSSNSSNSQERTKNNTQISYTGTDAMPIRKKQVTPFSLSHKQSSLNQQQRQQPQSLQIQQPSEYSGTKSVYTSEIDRDKSSIITKQQSYTSQNSSEGGRQNNKLLENNQNQLPTNGIKSQERVNSPFKTQNGNANNNQQSNINKNGMSHFSNGVTSSANNNNDNNNDGANLIRNYDSNSSNSSNKQNENNQKKQEAPIYVQNIASNNNSQNHNLILTQSQQQITLGQKQADRKSQKLRELNDSSSSSSSRPASKSPQPNQNNLPNLSKNSQSKNASIDKSAIEQKKQEAAQKQLIYIDCYDDEDEDEEEEVQFHFDQTAVDSIMRHQGNQNINNNNTQTYTNKTNSEYNRNARKTVDSQQQPSQLVDTTADSFNRDKFGKLRFSKPTSPKQLNTQVSGTNFNNNSFDQIAIDNKTVITDNTNKNKIGSLKQEQVKEYSKYFGQGQRSRNDDYKTSSIDQHIINQYMQQKQNSHNNENNNNNNNNSPYNDLTRHIDSINIDDYSESQFESYNSKEARSKQNIITKNY
ncbi:plant dual-specificity MAP kinase kinase family domain protein (macronuclear) [Tetrahymena thermophila SB210]|uniref:Plant dual-specificity MAP kinase kinase family domain protein n=1 Tax=Tetrahymena thermophila (strain SB210) TaxID=312017 RepID=Q22TH1_TETTS|nr:plant dual-specificity MAP kinase kinase family domain protein [Tetrahymena thermophila SB210]EAR88467.2 plant dual-specificity MAP kinase kinase family domain protein [Tetrahymena thermophila SB210]|eukprot:XP_001008712.2 plant dual-specificity MAP kinase kinase family domain protein [Tetrahymena thermophila SB210]